MIKKINKLLKAINMHNDLATRIEYPPIILERIAEGDDLCVIYEEDSPEHKFVGSLKHITKLVKEEHRLLTPRAFEDGIIDELGRLVE